MKLTYHGGLISTLKFFALQFPVFQAGIFCFIPAGNFNPPTLMKSRAWSCKSFVRSSSSICMRLYVSTVYHSNPSRGGFSPKFDPNGPSSSGLKDSLETLLVSVFLEPQSSGSSSLESDSVKCCWSSSAICVWTRTILHRVPLVEARKVQSKQAVALFFAGGCWVTFLTA